MAEKPIIFSTPMVRAILDGRKTQTRRVIKPQPTHHYDKNCPAPGWFDTGGNRWACRECGGEIEPMTGDSKIRARYRPGDILWVRETWLKTDVFGLQNGYMYKADEKQNRTIFENTGQVEKWRPSIFMPKEAARIFQRVTEVRPERLQDISVEDCIAEGLVCDNDINNPDPATHESIRNWNLSYAQFLYKELWDSLNAKRDGGKWEWSKNPWVWVYTFERCAKPADWPLTA